MRAKDLRIVPIPRSEANPHRGLSERQKLYVRNRLNNLSPTASALAAGYPYPSSASFTLERNPKVRVILDKHQKAVAEQLVFDRQRVLRGFMDAVDIAVNSTEVLNAWREIGKLVGVYDPERIEITHKLEEMTVAQLRAMSDMDLARLSGLHNSLPKADVIDAEFIELTDSRSHEVENASAPTPAP